MEAQNHHFNNLNFQNMITEMKEKGVHFGHKRNRLHPKAISFALKSSGEIYFINLEETVKGLEKALEFLKKIVQENGKILLVGTSSGAKKKIKELGEKYNFPYVIERWLGGTLTNFQVLKERINYLKELESQREQNLWAKYTKKEQLKLEKNYQLLEKKFQGLKTMESLPQALLVVDPKLHETAVVEAKKVNLPIVAILDTDDDPTLIDYPIPANDSAPSSIEYILGKIDKALEGAKNQKTELTQ
ncbi:MAG: 30S ribosomal protein S2 [Candidatus Paceibacterota bacterium]